VSVGFEGVPVYDQDLSALLHELEEQTNVGPNIEQPTAAMFSAVLSRSNNQPIHHMLSEAAATMSARDIKVGAAVSGLRTTLVTYFMNRYAAITGEDFSDPQRLTAADWIDPLNMLEQDLGDENSSAANYVLNMGIGFFAAVTPVRERYLTTELYAQLLRDRFPNGAQVLDIGSSIMAGPLYLMHKGTFDDQIGFQKVEFRERNNDVPLDLTETINEKIRRATAIRGFVCVDKFPVFDEDRGEYDPAFAAHARGGLRSSERNNPTYMHDLHKAMHLKEIAGKDSPVIFQAADLLNARDLAEFKEKFVAPFDIIVMNYVTQELNQEDQHNLHTVAEGLLSENGIIMYNHQAYLRRTRNNLRPATTADIIHYGSYATSRWKSTGHVLDRLAESHNIGLQTMMKSYDNRCQRVRLGMGKLVVNDSLVPIAELVQAAS
jgi:hypothetical protein